MGIKYDTSIAVNWGELLFILERRYNAACSYYKDGVEKLSMAKAREDYERFHQLSKDTLFNCESVLTHAALANSVRRFIGLAPRHYDLAPVKEMRAAMRKAVGSDKGGQDNG